MNEMKNEWMGACCWLSKNSIVNDEELKGHNEKEKT
jgi:hypothetical protein